MNPEDMILTMDTILHVLKAEGLYATHSALQRELEERYSEQTEAELRSREDMIPMPYDKEGEGFPDVSPEQSGPLASQEAQDDGHSGDYSESQAEKEELR